MRLHVGVSVFVALLVVVSGAWAGIVPITNPSFESPSCGTVGPATCAPTGWTVSGAANAFLPGSGAFQSIPDGLQVAYSNGGTLSQVLSTVIAANTTYTLSVWVSERVGDTFSPAIELLGGSNVLFTMSTSNPGGALPTQSDGGSTPYDWVDWTMSYTSPASGAIIGQALGISLGAGAAQSDFDNVSLTSAPVSSVPEPAMFALVGVGLLGLVTRRRFAK